MRSDRPVGNLPNLFVLPMEWADIRQEILHPAMRLILVIEDQ